MFLMNPNMSQNDPENVMYVKMNINDGKYEI